MALRCVKSLGSGQRASTTFTAQDRTNVAKAFSDPVNIPTVDYEHQSDIPSAMVLSRLSIFGLRRDMPDTHTEELARKARGAQQEKRDQVHKKHKSGTTSGPCFVAESRGGGWTTEDPSQHKI